MNEARPTPATATTAPDASWRFEHLDPRARWGMRLNALLLALLLFGVIWVLVAVVLGVALDLDWPAATAFAIVLASFLAAPPLAWFHGSARWRRTRYALTPQGLRIDFVPRAAP